MKISATILAAGNSTRMRGENKLLLSLGEVPIIARVVDEVSTAGFHSIIVVTGYDAESICAALRGSAVEFIHNEAWQTGMSSSIRTGMVALSPDVQGNLIVLGDMPFVSATTLLRLKNTFEQSGGDKIVYPTFEGRQANPVLFPRRFFAAIELIEGDQGCRSILKRYSKHTIAVPVDSEEVILDCDTKKDYLFLIEKLGQE